MKKQYIGLCFALLLILVITIFSIKGNQKHDDILKNGHEIIVQFIKKKSYPKTTDYYFIYYVGNEKKRTSNSDINYEIFDSDSTKNAIDSLKIRRFYTAKFLPKYPDAIIVNPHKHITDTAAILNAGFSEHDMTLPPKYSPDY